MHCAATATGSVGVPVRQDARREAQVRDSGLRLPSASLCVDAILFLVLIGRGGAGAVWGHLATFVMPPILGEGARAIVLYKRAKAKQSAPERGRSGLGALAEPCAP